MTETVYTIEGKDYPLWQILRIAAAEGYRGKMETLKKRAEHGVDTWNEMFKCEHVELEVRVSPLAELCASLDRRKAEIRKKQQAEEENE